MSSKILITGATGFLGKAVVNELVESGHLNITPLCSDDGNLTQKYVVDNLIEMYKPDVIIHLAAHVGGIGANMAKPAEFFFDNMAMGINLIDSAARFGIKKFVQVGTVCAYPKITPVPFQEKDLWNGYPEETNAPYGIAKKSLLVMLQAYRQQYGFNGIYLLPVNLYGPNDHFNAETSHVIPALILKLAQAKAKKQESIEVWGTGKASREFLYVKDCARAIRLAMESYDKPEPINIGSGMEITIANLVQEIQEAIDYRCHIKWNAEKPDGQPRRCLDTSKAKQEFNFQAYVSFHTGLKETVQWFYKEKFDANAPTGIRD